MQSFSSSISVFAVEVLLLGFTAPLLYFPDHFPNWTRWLAFALLAFGWLWRRVQLGRWRVKTPIDWPLFLLFLVMLPISIWAAPESLRLQYAWPRANILIWNFCLFWVVVVYSQREQKLFQLCLHGFIAAGVLIALLAPLGIAWLYKFPLLDRLLQQIPSPLIGVFAGAESGFHPNQVAGTLLYGLPLAVALSSQRIIQKKWDPQSMWLLGASVLMIGILLLTQSRAGLLGLGAGLAVISLYPSRLGRSIMVSGGIIVLLLLPFTPTQLFDLIGNSPTVSATGGNSLGFRQEVWLWATTALYDFPFTGMGLGTFREVVFLLYPINIDPNYNLGHAHNFFLQVGVDWGIPGLVAVLAIYGLAFWQLLFAQSTYTNQKGLTTGLLAALVAQTVYSQFDAVTMGAKTNLLFWWLLALVNAQHEPNGGSIL